MAHTNMVTEMQQPVIPKTCRHPTLAATEVDVSFAFICDGCQEMGYRSCYQCKNGCDYMLHKVCTMASEVAHHHFFEQRPFTIQLEQFPNSTNVCTACGIAVTGWRYYHTLENGSCIFLHPCCMMIPCIEEEKDGDRTIFLKQQLVSLKCEFCQRPTLEGPVKGWAYIYMSGNQKLLVSHVRCLNDKMHEDYWNMYGHTEEQERLGAAKAAKFWKFANAAGNLLVVVTNPVCWIMAVCDLLGFTITPS